MEDSQTWSNLINLIREKTGFEVPDFITEEDKTKLIQEAITKVNQIRKGEEPVTMNDVIEKLNRLKQNSGE